MQYLLSANGEAALAATMSLGPLLVFDFDGTLAPIVARPGDARVSVAVARRLERLARVLPVAIVTGRRVDDVAPRLRFQPRFIIGNHGAEDPALPPVGAEAALGPLRERLRAQAQALEAAGVDVEDKRLSVALHYRLAQDRHQAQSLITSVLRGPHERTRIFGGKCVVNVAPADAPDKADAVASLVRRCGAASAVFVGDDVNDEVVFERALPYWLTVRIGRDDPHSRARFFLDGHAEVGILLHRMLDFMDAR
jgi:trehalose 6-phosphate phosphatase